MAPVTRRSLGAHKAAAPTPDSISSAAVSDGDGDYSTPATSNAVTPAPSVSARPAPPRRLVVELPDIMYEPTTSTAKPFGTTQTRRTRASIAKAMREDDDEEEDELCGGDPQSSTSIALARKLQSEEDAKAAGELSLSVNLPLNGKNTGQGKRKRALAYDGDDPEDEDYKEEDQYDNGSVSAKCTNGDQSVARSRLAESSSDESNESDESAADAKRLAYLHRTSIRPASGPGGLRRKQLLTEEFMALREKLDEKAALREESFQSDSKKSKRAKTTKPIRMQVEDWHPFLRTLWKDLKKEPVLTPRAANQPLTISMQLKPFQLQGLAWMTAMEASKWKGGLLGDEMGLGKTIQAVSLIMSDYPAKSPSLVLVPPVALMQWTNEIAAYTDGKLQTLVFHGTNPKVKKMGVRELKKFDVILMSYNSLESMYRRQETGVPREEGVYKEKSKIHSIHFHRIILDEAHSIKSKTTMTAKACFALKADYRWCLSGTPLQNRIGELFSLLRFLQVKPFSLYVCTRCDCELEEWSGGMEDGRCTHCKHIGMQHVSVFNKELLHPIQEGGEDAKRGLQRLRSLTDRIMLRRLKQDHTDSMDLPVKEIYVNRQFFGEAENDFATSIMSNTQRQFNTYVSQGVMLNNYANIFGLIMQMRQVADHPDLLLKRTAQPGQNIIVCCICDEPAEDAIRSKCKHDFCRSCAKSLIHSQDELECPQCHVALSIDLEQPEIEQDQSLVKKSSIINRIKMENWTSSTKIELLVHELYKLRSDNASHKSIIFSQFTTMLQLVEWRLRRAGITTVMLDGGMTPAQRQASINHFMENVDVECFLVSLKAGGVALNLTEASRVFIVDPWWNPAAEWQSADRCHRIGQTRPCTITRLCIEDSVESRMVLLQEKKTSMINATVNNMSKAMEALSPADLEFLFRGN
ncbi:SNF2 family N-terminal domain-containing protein [Xylariomycetidae sp. FL0641]|nr:SNF2 family N-terminal domain-containing protein [Xylariomycetidae sp. FL0641]